MKPFLRSKVKERHYPLYSAMLTTAIFLLILFFSGILGYGNKTILSGDLFSQYTAFIQSFLNVLKGNGSFYYSFSVFFGNPATAGYAYYCLSPFNLLYLIPGISVSAMTAVIITLKLSLAAAMFQLFLSKGLGEKSPCTILFGTAYGLCTFAVSMCIHIMWLDALYTLPVIILLMKRYFNGSSILPLIPAYAYLFITNFYMGYIAGIFTALIFLSLLILNIKEKTRAAFLDSIKKCLLYAFSVLLSAGICAAVLLPTAYELLDKDQSRSAFTLFSVTLPDVLCNLFMGEMQGIGSPIPLIYCGLPVLLLLPAYFMCSRIEKREKLAAGFILIFYLAASQFLPLYRFLHAMEAPNWYAHRYAWCMVFLILTLCCRALPYLKEIPVKKYIVIVSGLMLLYAILIPFQKLCYGGYHTNSYGFFLINAAFLALYIALLHYSHKYKGLFLTILFSAELLINGCTCFSRNDFGFHSEDELASWEKNEQDIIPELLAADKDIYRVRVNGEICFNAPSRFGYMGLNTFTTTDNAKLRETLSSLGIGTSFMSIYDHGYTDLTDMLFGVKYSLNAQTGELSGSPLALPIGFMCSPGLLSWNNDHDVFTNQENLVSLMANKKYSFYTPLSVSNNNITAKNMEIYPFDDATLFQHISDVAVDGSINISFPESVSDNILAHFTSLSEPVIRNTAPTIEYPISGFNKSHTLSDESIVKALPNEFGIPCINLLFSRNGDFDYAVKNMYFCAYNSDNLADLRKDLGSMPLIINAFRNDEISGTVNASADRPILFFSIPYDKGWDAYIDDSPAPTYPVINDSFLSLELTPGTHNIRLIYSHPGADTGKLISGGSLLVLLILTLIIIKKSKQPTPAVSSEGSDTEA